MGFGYLQGFAPPRVVHRHRLSPLLSFQNGCPRVNRLADFRDLFSAAIRYRRLSPGPDPLVAFSLLQGLHTAATIRKRDFHDLSTATLEHHSQSYSELSAEMPAPEALTATMLDELLGPPPLLKFLPCLSPSLSVTQEPSRRFLRRSLRIRSGTHPGRAESRAYSVVKIGRAHV